MQEVSQPKAALVIIDVQRLLFDVAPLPHEGAEVIARINSLSFWARAHELPVIFIQHEQQGSPIEYGSQGWQLQADLHRMDGDICVRKTTPDAFLHTELQSLLSELQVSHLIVCGYASEFCVDTTVRRAAGLGYSVELVADAHTTKDKPHATAATIREHHNRTLPSIASFGVKIAAIDTATLLARS